MATDYRTLLINLLQRYDPTLDTSEGSPVISEVVDPFMTRVGPDPIDTPLNEFIYDRLAQEHPDLAPVPGDALSDISIGVMKTLLEPIRREIKNVRASQYLDSTTISDDEADAIVSNTFSRPRSLGNYSTGYARVYFSNPMSITITADSYVYTSDGRRYFPYQDQAITLQNMLLNEEDGKYYISVYVQAENPGTGYDIDANTLTGVYNVPNAVKVRNPDRFFGGQPNETTAQLLARVEGDLTERSLNTRAGAASRFNYEYPGTFSFLEMVRHGDPEMDRDVLSGSGGRDIYCYGLGLAVNNVFFTSTEESSGPNSVPSAGDRIEILFPPSMYTGLTPTERRIERTVVSVTTDFLFGGMLTTELVLDDDVPYYPADLLVPIPQFSPVVYWLSRVSPLSVTDLPGGIDQNTTLIVDPDTLHLGGFQDIYIRANNRDESSVLLPAMRDSVPIVSSNDLEVLVGSYEVSSSYDFSALGVRPYDVLSVLDGANEGVYLILRVDGTSLFVDNLFSAGETGLSFYVSRRVRVELTDPMSIKVPFGLTLANKLSTIVGSARLNTVDVDLPSFGVETGDTLRILTGSDAGDYTIDSFYLGNGTRPIVRKIGEPSWVGASSSATNLSYLVFSGSSSISLPLVRTTKMELLDASSQPSGVRIPYARPVLAEATAAFGGASSKGDYGLGMVVPKIPTSVIGIGDTIQFPVSPANTLASDLPLYVTKGSDQQRTSFFVGLPNLPWDVFLAIMGNGGTPEHVAPTYPDSPLSSATVGDTLTISTGPNRGSYTIKDVTIQAFHAHIGAEATDFSLVFIQVEEDFVVPSSSYIHDLLALMPPTGGTPYFRIDTWIDSLSSALNVFGFTMGVPTGEDALNLVGESYLVAHDCGSPAKGTARVYMVEPTSVELRNLVGGTGVDRAILEDSSGRRFYLDRNQSAQIFPDRRNTDPRDLPRDLYVYGAPGAGEVRFTANDPLLNGVAEDDEVWVYESLHKLWDVPAVDVVSGSSRITLNSQCPVSFRNTRPGHLLALGDYESGEDAEVYTVVEKLNSTTLVLDRAPGFSSPAAIVSGSTGTLTNDGLGNMTLVDLGKFATTTTSQYVAVVYHPNNVDYGNPPVTTLGKLHLITGVPDPDTITFSVGLDTLPSTGIGETIGWVVVATNNDNVPLARIYEPAPTAYVVANVETTYPNVALTLTRNGSVDLTNYQGMYQPYKIVRRNCFRVSVSEMENSSQYGMFYFDLPLVSEGVAGQYNIPTGTPLQLLDDTYSADGYTLEVGSLAEAYSDRERVYALIRSSILPTGQDDIPTNRVPIPNQGAQLDYEHSDLVSAFQSICVSDSDRVAVANTSVRHMLPALTYITVSYAGGSNADVLVPILQDIIDTTASTGRLEISDLEAEISKRGASYIDQDIHLFVVYWGRDRVLRAEHTKNYIDGSVDVPFLSGSRRLAAYISGPNRAGEEGVVIGERTTLIKTSE